MRIANVEYIRLSYRYKEEEVWGWPGGTYKGWSAGFVKITSDEGIYGIGETGDGFTAPDVVPPAIEQLKPYLLGQDPRFIRKLKDRMYRSVPTWGRRGLGISVMGGMEIALIDLVSKSLGVPAHVLLGGALRTRVPVYASGGMNRSLEGMADELKAHVARGYRAVKIRIGYGIDEDVQRVAAARQAVGPGIKLLLDYGASYLPQPPRVVDVVHLAREIEPYHPYWLEEPLNPDDIEGHAQLRKAISIPIAAGENTRTVYEVYQFLKAGAIDIIQTDAVYAGGMLEQLEIGHLAARHGVDVAFHTWGSAPGLMANLNVLCCVPQVLFFEYSQAHNPLRDRLLTQPVRLENGEVILPDGPGLGVDLTKEIEAEFPYDPAGNVISVMASQE